MLFPFWFELSPMPHEHNADRRHHTLLHVLSRPKMSFKIRNWPANEAGPRRRGSLTLWIEDAVLECWQTIGPDGQARYSDATIQTNPMVRTAFKLAASAITLMDLTISAPDHATISRRAVTLPVIQPSSLPHGPLHILIGSTGQGFTGWANGWRRSTVRSRAGNGANCIWRSMLTTA